MDSKILLPYQRQFIEGYEEHKFSIWNASRQIGKSFAVALLALMKAIETPKSTILIVSASERQAKELVEKVKLHLEFVKHLGKALNVDFFEDVKTQTQIIKFPNQSRIISVPSNPDTVRGFTADLLILDEFAFVQHDKELWRAVFPMITRKKEAKLVITSTPFGKSNMFYKLWTEADKKSYWYKQKTTIYDAVKQGLDVDVEILREGAADEETWRQEYLCEFIDEAGAFLPYELIQSCEAQDIKVENLKELEGDVYIGIDIGRKHDLTVISVLEKIGDVLYLRKQEIIKNLPFREQFNIIDHFTGYARRVAVDQTGLGMQLAEELQQKWGEIKVMPITFTAKTKEEMATKLKSKFQDKLIRIYPDKDLREDLHSVQKTITPSGNIKLQADRTERGHADRFWSLALTVYASLEEEPKVYIPPVFISSNPIGGSQDASKSKQMDSRNTWQTL